MKETNAPLPDTPAPRMLGRSSLLLDSPPGRSGIHSLHRPSSPVLAQVFPPRLVRSASRSRHRRRTAGRKESPPGTGGTGESTRQPLPLSSVGPPTAGPRPAGRMSPSYVEVRRNEAHPVHVLPLQGAKTALHYGIKPFLP